MRDRLKAEQANILNKQTMRKNELYTELQRNIFSIEAMVVDAKARKPALWRRLKTTQKRMKKLRDWRFVITPARTA